MAAERPDHRGDDAEVNWLTNLSNAERRRHKKAQDPDQPHPYYPRDVTNRKFPGHPLSQTVFVPGRGWLRVTTPKPCRVCGGSESLLVHAE